MKYHFKKAIFIRTIFLWNVFLFWVIWFPYSSDKMSTLDTIVKDYDKNIVLRDCQMQAFEYLHKKLSHDRSLHDHVFWDYFWDVYRDREHARTDNSVWEIVVVVQNVPVAHAHSIISGSTTSTNMTLSRTNILLGSVVELVIKLIIWLAIITFVIPNHILS